MERTANKGWMDSFVQYRSLAELWTFRLASEVLPRSDHASFQAMQALQPLMDGDLPYDREGQVKFWEWVKQKCAKLEDSRPLREGPLFRNARALCGHLGYAPIEEEILLLRVMARLCEPLRATLEAVGNCDDYRLAQVIAAALDAGHEQVLAALQTNSVLLASGLIRLERTVLDPIEKMAPIDGLSGVLTATYSSFDELFATLVRQPAKATLEMADFAHIEEKTSLLIEYLETASSSSSKGRNVLLYGPPGTGKTELARLAAAIAGAQLYEADVSHRSGQPLGVTHRLQSLVFVQQMVRSTSGAIVLFDELEDVFKPTQGPEPETRTVAAADSKGWTVQLLENNPAPTIWISNRVHQIDPAVIRRFDVVLEIPVPPLQVRRRILQRSLGRAWKDGDGVDSLLRDCAPAPALLTRAAAVVSMLPTRGGSEELDRFRTVMDGYLRARGQDWFETSFAEGLPFEPHLFNSVPHGEDVIAAIRENSRFRLLIHGPSGSGKTAFALHVARALGIEVFRATVRDLWSADPNDFASRIRDAFSRAERDRGLLLLDDMDWLVAATREAMAPLQLLALGWIHACLDQHGGPVICTIASEGYVEHGVLRRFGVRLKTGCLSPTQAARMARALLTARGGIASAELDRSEADIAAQVRQLGPVTAGDFIAANAAILKANGLHEALHSLSAHLEDTVALRAGGPTRPIGFIRREGPRLSTASG
jgi:AAA+ superfamily predicted ATPase